MISETSHCGLDEIAKGEKGEMETLKTCKWIVHSCLQRQGRFPYLLVTVHAD